VLESEAYKYVQTYPTEWTRRCSPTATGRYFRPYEPDTQAPLPLDGED